MKGILVFIELAIASLAFANDDQCPPEQATNSQIEKLLRHDDCNKFYQCTHGKPVEKICPSNLYFNLNTWQCDWPSNVDCSGRNDPSLSSSTPAPTPTTTTTTTSIPTTTTTPAPTTTTPAPTTITPTPTIATPDDQCPPEQAENWAIEKLLRHDDCNKYYQCTFGKPVEKICPSNLYFNLNTWQCDWPDNVDCSGRNDPNLSSSTSPPTTITTPTPTTTTSIPTTITPKPTTATPDNQCPPDQADNWAIEKLLRHDDCNKYYQCTHGKPVEKICPSNLYFNLNTWQCDWPDNVDCSDRNVPELTSTSQSTTTPQPTPAPTTATPDDQCPPEQAENWEIEKLLRHADCNKYYQCTHGKPVEEICPSNLYFNLNTWLCDWPENVDCSDRNVPESTTATQSPTTIKPTTAPSTSPTPTPTSTSRPSNNCTCPTTTTTRRPTTTTTTAPLPNPDFLPNGCPVNPHIHWLLPHETDCNLFYYCVWGEKVLRRCPSSLHFNRKIQVCDWPIAAGCTTSKCKKVKKAR